MTQFARIASVAALAGLIGCGKSPEQQQVEQIQKNAQQMAQRPRRCRAMRRTSPEASKRWREGWPRQRRAPRRRATSNPSDPVDFKELQAMLPDVAGWEKSQPEAERMTAPVSFAYASTRYKKGDFEITEKITDSGFNQLLIAPLSMMLAAGYAKESTQGFEKSTTAAGYPAFEKWDKSDKSGNLTVFVNQRFVVELEGTGMTRQQGTSGVSDAHGSEEAGGVEVERRDTAHDDRSARSMQMERQRESAAREMRRNRFFGGGFDMGPDEDAL